MFVWRVGLENLVYLIYILGLIGWFKGVMVEYCNVVNFFVGMDVVILYVFGDVWLVVISLFFDILVLEIFWLLVCGLCLVIVGEELWLVVFGMVLVV